MKAHTNNNEGEYVMDQLTEKLDYISDLVWGAPLLILLVGTGIFLTLRLAFLQIGLMPYSLKLVFSKNQDKKSEGDISHFQALMTALAATVGVGYIVGVATAVVLGGPGAEIWIRLAGLTGMATRCGEGIVVVRYRVKDNKGEIPV